MVKPGNLPQIKESVFADTCFYFHKISIIINRPRIAFCGSQKRARYEPYLVGHNLHISKHQIYM